VRADGLSWQPCVACRVTQGFFVSVSLASQRGISPHGSVVRHRAWELAAGGQGLFGHDLVVSH